MASKSRTLYIGVTANLSRRVQEHRTKASEFTARYRITRLVYVEATDDVRAAIAREKQLKGWLRRRKLELIAAHNPRWLDLA